MSAPCAPIVLAVATYRRPELLAELLPALIAQARGLDRTCVVVVVDNDPAESARPVVAPLEAEDVVYLPEPEPGIAAARNRGLDHALSSGAEAIVYVDDDEEPEDAWLRTLVDAWQEWKVAAVAGPVISHFDGDVDPWVAVAPTFARPRRRTGAALGGAATNNLILSLAALGRHDLRFDNEFGLTGGSDTMLTHALVKAGEEIRWCDEAVMHETVPAERATREWVLRRTFRTGNVWSRVALALAQPERTVRREKLDLRARGVKRIATGWGRVVRGRLVGDLPLRVQGRCDVATGRGVLRGTKGRVVTEYVRTG